MGRKNFPCFLYITGCLKTSVKKTLQTISVLIMSFDSKVQWGGTADTAGKSQTVLTSALFVSQ